MSTYVPNISNTGFPPTFVNAYILSEMQEFGLIGSQELAAPGTNPMVPAQFPTNIEDLYNDSIQIRQNESPLLMVYDRLMRFRSTAFYRNKKEQLVYFIYTTDVDKLINSVRLITDALDREDAAAQDVNKWLIEKSKADYPNLSGLLEPGFHEDYPGYRCITGVNGKPTPINVFFHNFKIYQADESRDVAELASARTLFVNKIIIEYDYHTITPANYKYN